MNQKRQGSHAIIIPEGGEMTARAQGKNVVPDVSVVHSMIQNLPAKLRGMFEQIDVITPEDPAALLSKVTTQRLMESVWKVRNALQSADTHVIMMVDHRKAAQYASALAMGLHPEDLGDQAESVTDNAGKSFIVVASSQTPDKPGSKAQEIFNNALYLSIHHSMKGKAAALLSPNTLQAMPGLLRTEAGSTLSRFKTMADRNAGEWYFGESSMGEDKPIGKDELFQLQSGVHTEEMQDHNEDEPEREFLKHLDTRLAKEEMRGLVVRTQSRQDPFITLSNEFLSRLDALGFPVVLVNDALDLSKEEPSELAGDYSYLADGRRMTGPEAKILLAKILHDTRGMDQSRQMQHVHDSLAAYPFR